MEVLPRSRWRCRCRGRAVALSQGAVARCQESRAPLPRHHIHAAHRPPPPLAALQYRRISRPDLRHLPDEQAGRAARAAQGAAFVLALRRPRPRRGPRCRQSARPPHAERCRGGRRRAQGARCTGLSRGYRCGMPRARKFFRDYGRYLAPEVKSRRIARRARPTCLFAGRDPRQRRGRRRHRRSPERGRAAQGPRSPRSIELVSLRPLPLARTSAPARSPRWSIPRPRGWESSLHRPLQCRSNGEVEDTVTVKEAPPPEAQEARSPRTGTRRRPRPSFLKFAQRSPRGRRRSHRQGQPEPHARRLARRRTCRPMSPAARSRPTLANVPVHLGRLRSAAPSEALSAPQGSPACCPATSTADRPRAPAALAGKSPAKKRDSDDPLQTAKLPADKASATGKTRTRRKSGGLPPGAIPPEMRDPPFTDTVVDRRGHPAGLQPPRLRSGRPSPR